MAHKTMNLHLATAVGLALAVACGQDMLPFQASIAEPGENPASAAHKPRASHGTPDVGAKSPDMGSGGSSNGGATGSGGAAGTGVLGARASGGAAAAGGAPGNADAGMAAGGINAGQTKLGELTTPDQASAVCDRISDAVDTLKWTDAFNGFCARAALAKGEGQCQASLPACVAALPGEPDCSLELLRQCPDLSADEYVKCRVASSRAFVDHYEKTTCGADSGAPGEPPPPDDCAKGSPSVYDLCPALAPFAWTTPAEPPGVWADTWYRAPQATVSPSGDIEPVLPTQFANQTLREILWTTLGGSQVRVKLTNAFSKVPLDIGAAHLALPATTGGTIIPESDRPLTFGGKTSLTIPAGAEAWSDPVALTVEAHTDLALSLYLPGTFAPQAVHPTGSKTSYLSTTGDFTGSATMRQSFLGLRTTTMVFFASDVEVRTDVLPAEIVALGDSITDGYCSTVDTNGDWPDLLSSRLPPLPDGTPVGVINAGISSNRLTASDEAGIRGIDRLPELLRSPGVRWVILLDGLNDISYEQTSSNALIAAYQHAITLAHAAHVKIFGVPLLPFKGSVKDTPANQTTRSAVNDWIRTSKAFDAVIDFDPVLANPSDPATMKAALTCDYVHPNQAGYRAMVDSIDLTLFR